MPGQTGSAGLSGSIGGGRCPSVGVPVQHDDRLPGRRGPRGLIRGSGWRACVVGAERPLGAGPDPGQVGTSRLPGGRTPGAGTPLLLCALGRGIPEAPTSSPTGRRPLRVATGHRRSGTSSDAGPAGAPFQLLPAESRCTDGSCVPSAAKFRCAKANLPVVKCLGWTPLTGRCPWCPDFTGSGWANCHFLGFLRSISNSLGDCSQPPFPQLDGKPVERCRFAGQVGRLRFPVVANGHFAVAHQGSYNRAWP